ncbi:MAG: hypothetical protein HC828_03475 [Blastochloris sp.]|nr:hypothetical protein [Blastochloris sp.]
MANYPYQPAAQHRLGGGRNLRCVPGVSSFSIGSTQQNGVLAAVGNTAEHRALNPSFRRSVGCTRQQGVQAGIHSYGRVGVLISIT